MKLCRNCEFFKNTEYGFLCANSAREPDVVTGLRELNPCYVERDSEIGLCGPSGKNFKPSLSYQFSNFIRFRSNP